MKRFTACAIGFVVLGISPFVHDAAATTVVLNGETFQSENGLWYFEDEYGELWQIAPNIIQIKFSSSTTEAQRIAFASAHDLQLSPALLPRDYHRFRYNLLADPVEVLEDVLGDPTVSDADLDTYVKPLGPPTDEYYSSGNMWNLFKIDMERAWEVTTGNAPVIIGVIDWGIDQFHEDLAETRWTNTDGTNDTDCMGRDLNGDTWGWDFMEEDSDPAPHGPHGTAVAGMACAASDNSDVGIASIAGGRPGNRPIKWASLVGVTDGSILDSIKYCKCKNIKIINMSFTGGGPMKQLISDELDLYYAQGGLPFAGSGNNGTGLIGFPASHPTVVAVGATNDNDVRWNYSTYGPDLELVAPSGEDVEFDNPDTPPFVWSCDNPHAIGAPFGYNPDRCFCPLNDELYVSQFGGTSAASPQAAALAALIWSHNPTLSNAQVRAILHRSARDLGSPGEDDQYGHGRIDAYRALTQWGTISSNTTWGQPGTPSTIVVSGDLTVEAGVTLTIMAGTTIKVASDDNEATGADPDKIEFNVEGTLLADGTAANPIRFESWTPTTTQDWVGFYFDDQSGGGTFDNCIISRAEYAIESYKPLTLKNTTIEDCYYAGVLVQAGNSLVQGCTIRRVGTYGVFLTTANTTVRNTAISYAGASALQVQPNAAAVIRNSQFLNSGTGLTINTTAAANIDTTCVFNSNAVGIYCYGTPATLIIKNSTINSNTGNGIRCDYSSHPVIQSNTLRYNALAIYCTNSSSPVIKWNVIKSNTSGVSAATDANPDIGDCCVSGGNTFAFNTGKHVWNWNEFEIHAENNCWNVNTGDCYPPPAKIYGPVDTSSPICCTTSPAGAAEIVPDPEREQPQVTGIVAVVPNPFNPSTTIHYDLASHEDVRIVVYDVAGRVVRELVSGRVPAGSHSISWEGVDAGGSPVASGIYFVRLSTSSVSRTMKLALLK